MKYKHIQFIPIIGVMILYIFYPKAYWGRHAFKDKELYMGPFWYFFLSVLINFLSIMAVITNFCKI